MKMVRLLSAALMATVLLVATLSAETTVNAFVDRKEISEGESVEYTIEIKGDIGKLPTISLPNLPDWQVYSQSTATNYSWVNGRSESSKQFHFTLAPTRSGRLLVPSLTVPLDGKSHATPQITVTVNPVAMSPQTRNVPQNPGRSRAQPSQSRKVAADDLLLRSMVDRDTVYVNQQVTLSIKFYYRARLLSTPEPRIPQRTGFWAEDLGQWRSGEESYGGRDYGVFELRTALFPAAPGVQTIGSSEMNVVVDDGASVDPFAIFNQQFPSFGGRRLTLKSDPIKVITLPLPDAGKPADFGGAVGQYQMTATVDKTKIEVNEPLTMHIKISGVGNIKGIAIPKIPELPDFRSYLAGDSEKIEKVNYQVGGTKSFDQAFIPKRSGSYLLPGLKFSFFDPKARAYKTLTTDPIQIEVAPSKDRYASQVQNLQTNRIDLNAKDIRYLKADLGEMRSSHGAPISANPLFLLVMYLAPLLGYISVVIRQRHKERLQSDVGFRRLRHARKLAEGRLAKAKNLLDSGGADAFYAEINHSLIDYFADRYNLAAFGLTSDKIKEYAEGKQSDMLVGRLLELLQQCDFGRFAPGGGEKSQMTILWENARKLIVELEKTR